MKILVLCNKSPWPKSEGGPIALHAMITGLINAGHEVKVLAANSKKSKVDPHSIPAPFAEKSHIELIDIDLSFNLFHAFADILTGNTFYINRFHTSAYAARLEAILQEEHFDIIQIEMPYMGTYLDIIRKHSHAPVVLRTHNIEHKIWERAADNTSNIFKQLYLKYISRSLRKFEKKIFDSVDGIVAITPIDARNIMRITNNKNVIFIPFGLSYDLLPKEPMQPQEPSLFHIGAMNWFPNEEGIKWFLTEVWPNVLAKAPNLKLHLAGRYMPDWLQRCHSAGVTNHGEVPDVWDFMKQYAIMIVPLFSGSGIRIKIVEAMAAGRAIVTTHIGAEGINYINGHHLLIAKDAPSFTQLILKLYNDPVLRNQLGENARQLIMKDHITDKLMVKLTTFYEELINP